MGNSTGEAKISQVMKAGFSHFKRTTQTPLDQIPVLAVYEAKRQLG